MLDEKRHKAKLKFPSFYKVLWIILSSVSDPDSIMPVNPDLGGQKCPTKIEKLRNCMF
jgi:hypothetical protein